MMVKGPRGNGETMPPLPLGSIVPIAGARISVHPDGRELISEGQTDAKGLACLGVVPGTYVVRVSAAGFGSTARNVNVKAGATVQLVVKMEALPASWQPGLIMTTSQWDGTPTQ